MNQSLVEEPFRKHRTKPLNFENVLDQIFKVNRSVLNKFSTKEPLRFSPLPKYESPEPTRPLSLFDKIMKSDHRINSKKIQIIKLPKLPFGRHQNYNSEDLFVTNHFIPSDDTEKTYELDEIVKKYRLFEKQYNKSRKTSMGYIKKKLTEKDKLVFKTKAGLLICKKNQAILNKYEEYSSKYKNKVPKEVESAHFEPVFPESKTQRTSRVKIDPKHIVERLYPTPQPSTNRILNDLLPKYPVLFSEDL